MDSVGEQTGTAPRAQLMSALTVVWQVGRKASATKQYFSKSQRAQASSFLHPPLLLRRKRRRPSLTLRFQCCILLLLDSDDSARQACGCCMWETFTNESRKAKQMLAESPCINCQARSLAWKTSCSRHFDTEAKKSIESCPNSNLATSGWACSVLSTCPKPNRQANDGHSQEAELGDVPVSTSAGLLHDSMLLHHPLDTDDAFGFTLHGISQTAVRRPELTAKAACRARLRH